MVDKAKRLEESGDWDFEMAESRPPVRGRRAIVSVAFPPDDLTLVARSARNEDMKLSEFIRLAAVEKATLHQTTGEVHLTGTAARGEATFLFPVMALNTRGSGTQLPALVPSTAS